MVIPPHPVVMRTVGGCRRIIASHLACPEPAFLLIVRPVKAFHLFYSREPSPRLAVRGALWPPCPQEVDGLRPLYPFFYIDPSSIVLVLERHASWLPHRVVCRDGERSRIVTYVRVVILDGQHGAAAYCPDLMAAPAVQCHGVGPARYRDVARGRDRRFCDLRRALRHRRRVLHRRSCG